MCSAEVALRCWTLADAAQLRDARDVSSAELSAWTPGILGDLQEIDDLLERLVEAFEHGDFNAFAIEARGEVVGYLSMRRTLVTTVELAYWVRTDQAGKGIATAAVTLARDTAFATWASIERVVLRCDAANTASRRVASKAGFLQEAEAAVERRTPAQSGTELLWGCAGSEDPARWPGSHGVCEGDEVVFEAWAPSALVEGDVVSVLETG